MALDTYTTIQASIAKWLARTGDSSLELAIPDFIGLAESRIHYGSDHPQFPSDPLRIRAMETAADLSITSATVALPTGYIEARRLFLDGATRQVLTVAASPQAFYTTYPSTTPGVPQEYIIEGENLVLGPTPDQSYTGKMLYYKKFDPLATTASNWLTANAPGAYLYGALLEAAPYLEDDPRLPLWFGMFSAAIGGLNGSNDRDRWSGSILVVRSDTGNP